MRKFNVFAIIITMISLISCGSQGSSNKGSNDFWEGNVKPGIYNISWRESSAYGTNANKVSIEIAIFDNQEFEIRRKTECGLDRIYHTDITTMTGFVRKKREVYNGSEQMWYQLEGTDSDKYHFVYSITPSGSFYDTGNHWQFINNSRPIGRIY